MAEENGPSRTEVFKKRYGNRFKKTAKRMKGGITSSLVCSIIVHIAMIVIGSMNVSKCPAEHNIPIFLIVTGVVGIISKALTIGRNYLIRYITVSPVLSIAGFVEFVMFICGSCWVFKEFEPSYNPADGERYCNKTAYLFSFVYILSIYVIILLILLVVCCLCMVSCTAICIAADEVDDVRNEEARQEESPLSTPAKVKTAG